MCVSLLTHLSSFAAQRTPATATVETGLKTMQLPEVL